jgi:hypothetical protein
MRVPINVLYITLIISDMTKINNLIYNTLIHTNSHTKPKEMYPILSSKDGIHREEQRASSQQQANSAPVGAKIDYGRKTNKQI